MLHNLSKLIDILRGDFRPVNFVFKSLYLIIVKIFIFVHLSKSVSMFLRFL